MFKKRTFLATIISLAGLMICLLVTGQSRQDGIKLFNEAVGLHKAAQSAEDLKKAVDKYEQALKIFETVNYKEGIAGVANDLGTIYQNWGQFDKAADFFEKSLVIEREMKDRLGEARSLSNLGSIYHVWGPHHKAEEYYTKCIAIFREFKDSQAEARALSNLGTVYEELGQYNKAMECCEKGLQIATALKDHQIESRILFHLGYISIACGHYGRAEEYCEKSLALCRDLKNPKGEAIALVGLGLVHGARGDYDKALASSERGLEIYYRIGTPTAPAKDLMSNLYLDKGDVEKAEALIKDMGNPASLGRLELVKKNYQGAKAYYEKVCQFAEEAKTADDLFTSYTGLGLALEGMGDKKQAAEYYLKAVKLTDELISSVPGTDKEAFLSVRVGGFPRTAPYDGLTRVRTK